MSANTDTTLFPTTRFTLLAKLNDPAAKAWDEFFSVYGPVIYHQRTPGSARLWVNPASP